MSAVAWGMIQTEGCTLYVRYVCYHMAERGIPLCNSKNTCEYASQTNARHPSANWTLMRAAGDIERGEVESRYSNAYEEKINPFTDFRSKERESRRKQMNVADRVMFEFWHFVSGNK